jgi:large subunit ribosomal protein L28e
MSDSLVWLCVKDGNAFMRKKGNTAKRGGVMMFSAEPGNLMSLNSFKFSGLANSKTIGFSAVEGETAGKKDVRISMSLKVSMEKDPVSYPLSHVHSRVRLQRTARSLQSRSQRSHSASNLTWVLRSALPAR